MTEGALVAMAYGHSTVVHGDPVTQHVVPLPNGPDPVLGRRRSVPATTGAAEEPRP